MAKGRVVSLKGNSRLKSGTPSSRQHRFETFSERIAKINIDPVRRIRRNGVDNDTESYFKAALHGWQELNLSENFTLFARAIRPLCETLPQVVHHQDSLMDQIVEYVEKDDTHSLEPLLSLLSHFAHDLGASFEKHFARAVSTITRLATRHQDVEVIEWSFTCLAWLFKYLARLLVPDLRPIYDLLSPLLGKDRQKPFIVRFAAEALSFLIRKAGSTYYKNPSPLAIIVKYILDDLNATTGTDNSGLFQAGIMTLFAESIKGVQRSVHSSGPAIFHELLLQVMNSSATLLNQSADDPAEQVLQGILIAIIHHTEPATFAPILSGLLEDCQVHELETDHRRLVRFARLIFLVAGVRRGTRILNWAPIVQRADAIARAVDRQEPQIFGGTDVTAMLSVVFQTCPLEVAIPHIRVLDVVSAGRWKELFLPFCNFFADMGIERFESLLLPHLKKFISTTWEEEGDRICVLLPRLARLGGLTTSSIFCPCGWQEAISSDFDLLLEPSSQDGIHVSSYAAYLDLTEAASVDEQLVEKISSSLATLFHDTLRPTMKDRSTPPAQFACGIGFEYLIRKRRTDLVDESCWPALCHVCSDFETFPVFWGALLGFIQLTGKTIDLQGSHMLSLRTALFACISSSSHALRLACLRVCSAIHLLRTGQESELLGTAIKIEESPLTIQSARSLSMYTRKLGSGYDRNPDDEYLGEAIPRYCFGLLHMRLAPVWEDACESLKTISGHKQGEAIIAELACDWITVPTSSEPQSQQNTSTSTSKEAQSRGTSDFECTNINNIRHAVISGEAQLADVPSQLRSLLLEKQQSVPLTSPTNRTQALLVLNKIPGIAEKRSRIFVPILLKWIGSADRDANHKDDDDNIAESLGQENRWTRKDQKALLSLFAQFTNPKVLYKSKEVYDALLALLTNGDVEIQRAALKALTAWKPPGVTRNATELFDLLEDPKFREQLLRLLQIGDDEDSVQIQDQEAMMPFILRLLYGRMVSRSGSAVAQGGQEARRKAIFVALARPGDELLERFLEIALGPLHHIQLVTNGILREDVLEQQLLSVRKQAGLLNMLKDMTDTLGIQLGPWLDNLVPPVLFCAIKANRQIEILSGDSGSAQKQNTPASLIRSVRQVGIYCLTAMCKIDPQYNWSLYAPAILHELVRPRLDSLPIETAQSVSGLLRLFSAWAASLQTGIMFTWDNNILIKTAECLRMPFAKEEVKLFVLQNIIQSLVKLVKDETMSTDISNRQSQLREQVLIPNSGIFLKEAGQILRGSASRNLLEVATQTLAQLSEFIHDTSGSEDFIDICCYFLQQPSKQASPKTKSDLLDILHRFVPQCDFQRREDLADKIFESVCVLFSFFRDRVSRERNCAVLQALSAQKPELSEVASLCSDMNSFSTARLDEPDFERRTEAFATINQTKYATLGTRQWRPLLFNMLFFVRDEEELVTRMNASFGLRRFVETASQHHGTESESFRRIVQDDILPAIYRGIRTASELVRTEYLTIVAAIVTNFPQWDAVADMQDLLVGNDEEASFFTNILHIQQHRRLRALRRLANAARSDRLSASNIHDLFIPLLEHFILDQEDNESARALAAETITTLASLAESLEWPQYRAMLRRYTGYVESKADMEKTTIKLVGSVIDALSHAARAKGYGDNRLQQKQVDDTMEIDKPARTLSRTLPVQAKVSQELVAHILPPMVRYLHRKDESTVSLRVPVAIAVSKVLQILPADELNARLPAVLMDICNILRSKASESRDMARTTLAQIALIIGPAYFGFILKALRGALHRGYQLHVLSYTMHTILVTCVPRLVTGDLDYVVHDIVSIIMDDIFGVIGQEKDAQDYVSKMREVKSSKSFDSMEMVTRLISLSHLGELIRPLHALLREKLTIKMIKKIDELLRRIGLGISQNEAANDRNTLVFCYEIIQEAHRAKTAVASTSRPADYKTSRYLINMNGARSGSKGATASHHYKMTRFAFDLLRVTLRKHTHLQTPANIAGFMPAVGDALVDGAEEVQISAIRLITAIIKIPWPQLDEDAPEYIFQCTRIVKAAPSTNTELAQAALKLVAAILRERRNTEVQERDVAYLLKKIKPDLEEPDRQGVTFNFLRSVLGRKIVVVEVYEVVDAVATIMVTNQTRGSRDLARGVYFQFLMEYPQAKNRLSKQLAFLVRHLTYQHAEGRQSVMEALHLILTKFGDDLIQDILDFIFAPLVMAMVNDDTKECREMAGVLLRTVFQRADKQRRKSFLTHLRTWLHEDQKVVLQRVSLQCWTLFFEVHGAKSADVSFVLAHISRLLSECADSDDTAAWETLFFALKTFSGICDACSDIVLSSSEEHIWASVHALVSHLDPRVKITAAKLTGGYFADFVSINKSTGFQSLPLIGSRGLRLEGDTMVQIASTNLRALNDPTITDDVAKQVAQNILFLGRCFAANQFKWKKARMDESDGATDDGSGSASEDDELAEILSMHSEKLALQFLFERLSVILRREPPHTRADALHAKSAAMQVISALCSALNASELEPSLRTILLPLHHLTDTSIPAPSSLDEGFNDGYKELRSAAQGVVDILQKKFGTTRFVEEYQKVRQGVQGRREGRKAKRRIEAVSKPEKFGNEKRRKREALRSKRKEKNMEMRGRRRGW